MIEIVRASPAHIGVIANRMRAHDVEECRAMGHEPKPALRSAMRHSSEVWTAKVDGRPEAMFGIVVTSALGGEGKPWMLGSDEIYRHPRAMLRSGHLLLNRWLDSTPHLSGLVSLRNSRAIRMLRRWDCQIGEEIHLFGGQQFVEFCLSREEERTP